MLRSILAVIAGFASWTVLWLSSNQLLFRLFRSKFDDQMMSSDTGLLAAILALSVLFSIVAGWITAAVAKRSPIPHTLALGAVQLAVGIFVQSMVWDQMPLWYHLVFLTLLVPGNVVGGWLRGR